MAADIAPSAVPFFAVIGRVGSGKTTMIERLFPWSGAVRSNSIFSDTSKSTVYCGLDLWVCDTPGLNSSGTLEEAMKQNIWVMQALTSQPLSGILLLTTGDRLETAYDNVKDTIFKFRAYKDLITVLVNKTEAYSLTDKIRGLQWLESADPTVKFKLISTAHDNLRALLQDCIRPKRRILIEDSTFTDFFTPNVIGVEIRRRNAKDKVAAKIDAMLKALDEALLTAESQDELIDLHFSFRASIRDELPKLRQEFMVEAGLTFLSDPNDALMMESLHQLVKAKLLDLSSKCDKFNRVEDSGFRACPHCGEVWVKVSGCEEETTCGNRESKFDFRTAYQRFVLRYVSGRWAVVKQPVPPPTPSSRPVRPRGCGKKIVWKTLRIVPHPPEFQTTPKELDIDKSLLSSTEKTTIATGVRILKQNVMLIYVRQPR